MTVDVLGGVDVQQVERMICTLRITYQSYPPLRSTLDLYNDQQTDKLIRSLCDKWGMTLTDVSKSIHAMITQLESYKLDRLQYPQSRQPDFEPNQQDRKKAVQFLKNRDLLDQLIGSLNRTGILGEDENAVILFLALASYKFSNPFSVICLAKSGIGKSYMLQKISECMPPHAYTFHTKISANALYYFDSHQINGKALFIEDLEWTAQMLQPLATLQTQGRLMNTRATKDKDGMLHSTTFEVVASLCLLACAYSDKNFEEISLPFLCLHLNHSHTQDLQIMEYQKRCKAGQISTEEVRQAQHLLKCAIATLQNISVINPYATLINLPEQVAYPRKSLLLLLNFIEVITYFFQYQREQLTDPNTGEVFIKTHPADIELAFKFLKNNLFRRSDELSASARGFYNWLQKFLAQAKTSQFTALDIRQAKPIHPRTLNRYLQELKLFSYIQIAGGNKHREGFIYKLTSFGNHTDAQSKIERSIEATLKAVWDQYNKEQTEHKAENLQAEPTPEPEPVSEAEPVKEPEQLTEKQQQNAFISSGTSQGQGAADTYQKICSSTLAQSGEAFNIHQVCGWTGRAKRTENRHLKTLFDKGLLTRFPSEGMYCYRLAITDSRTVSQNPATNLQTQAQ